MRRFRTEVRLVCLVQCADGLVGSLAIVIFGFVVKKGDLEMVLVRSFLQQAEVMIGKGTRISVPVDDEGGNAGVASLLNLPAKDRRIITGIAHVHVNVVAKPRHVNGKYFGPGVRSLEILLQRAVYAGRGTPAAHHKAHNRQN